MRRELDRRQPQLRARLQPAQPVRRRTTWRAAAISARRSTTATFGQATPNNRFDPELLRGWGKRFSNWEFSAGVQHEILPRVSLDVGYFRRWYGNFAVQDNLNVAAADYDTVQRRRAGRFAPARRRRLHRPGIRQPQPVARSAGPPTTS